MTAARRALVSVAFGTAMAASTFIDSKIALMCVVVIMCAAIAVGWPRLLELPHSRGSIPVVMGAGIAGTLVSGFTTATTMKWLVMICAIGVFASFIHQMFRRERDKLTESVTGTMSGVLVALFASGWVLTEQGTSAVPMVLAGACAITMTLLVLLIKLPGSVRDIAALILGIGTAIGLSLVVPGMTLQSGAYLGVGVCLVTVGMEHLLGRLSRSHENFPLISAGAAPICVSGLVVYIISRIFNP